MARLITALMRPRTRRAVSGFSTQIGSSTAITSRVVTSVTGLSRSAAAWVVKLARH